MTEFFVGDIVRVEMPRGYSTRGVLGISLLFSTSPEAKFEGAIGTVTQFNPTGPQSVHQYLVDFRTHDNSRIGIPWQAQWFREEWLALIERPHGVVAAAVDSAATATATWPSKPETVQTAAGIAHPDAKIFTEGRKDFAPGNASTDDVSAQDVPFTAPDQIDDRSAADVDTFNVTADPNQGPAGSQGEELIVDRGEGFVKVRGMAVCPDGFPIKGNTNSGIFHAPADKSYAKTVPEICFASEDVATEHGFRAPARRG